MLCVELVAPPLFGQGQRDAGPQTPASSSHAAAESPDEVLVLYSAHSSWPISDDLALGFRQGLLDSLGKVPRINNEYLDLTRFKDGQYTQQLVDLIRSKYVDSKIGVVVSFDLALPFATNHLRDVFPQAVFLFAVVEENRAERLIREQDVTGVAYRVDVAKTCELARTLNPRLRRVICISGRSAYDDYVVRLAKDDLALLTQELQIEYWQGVPVDEMTQRVRDLPDDCAVMFLVYYSDKTGRDYAPAEVVAKLSHASPVPVFGLWDTLLTHDVVGGHVIRIQEQAIEAGRMAGQILQGNALDVPPMRGPESNESILNWDRLRHWSIPAKNVPAGVVLRNRRPPIWETYRWQIATIFGVVAVQFGLIALLRKTNTELRREVNERLRAEEQARRNQEQLARVARAASMGELTTSIAHEVKQPLFAIVSNAQTGKRLLANDELDRQELSETLQDIANDGNRAAHIIDRVRSLTRKQQPTPTALDLNTVVCEVVELVRPDAEAQRVKIRTELAEDMPQVSGDRVELQQVILNLLMNGAQAMRDVAPDSRELTVQTSHSKGWVHVTVQDRGKGLGNEQLDRIFDAFYTTKSGGVGMGLAISRTIIEGYEGKIWATQNSAGGATLHVKLPVASSHHESIAASPARS